VGYLVLLRFDDNEQACRRLAVRLWTLIALVAAPILLVPSTALATCHVSAFRDGDVTVVEANTTVQLVVELTNNGASPTPNCEGALHYKTVNGTAKTPGDYTSAEGELNFRTGDDRTESITITIKNDTVHEQQETFTVSVTRSQVAPGNVNPPSSPAIVRISDDNDPSPSPSPSPKVTISDPCNGFTPCSPSPSPSRTPTVSPSASDSPTASESPTPSETPTPIPTETDTGLAAPPSDEGGGNGGKVAAIAVALILLGGGTGLWFIRKRYGFR
jgi:Calx-beta domain-containing protein